jgi:hypothetical protein
MWDRLSTEQRHIPKLISNAPDTGQLDVRHRAYGEERHSSLPASARWAPSRPALAEHLVAIAPVLVFVCRSLRAHIGGLRPSEPTAIDAAVSLPSSFNALMKTADPSFTSVTVAGPKVTIGAVCGTRITCLPPL